MESPRTKISKLIFLDTVADAESFMLQDIHKDGARDSVIIAMKPSVGTYLLKRGIRCEDTTAYFTNDSHVKALERSESAIDRLRKEISFSDPSFGVRKAYNDAFIFWVRSSLHYFIWAAEIVSKAIARHRPETVHASCAGQRRAISLYVEPEERYLGRIIRDLARLHGLTFNNITDSEKRGYSKRRFDAPLREIIRYVRRLMLYRAWAFLIKARKRFFDRKRATVFFTTRFYQMDALAEQLGKELSDTRVCLLPSPVIPAFSMPDTVVRLLWRRTYDSYSRLKAQLASVTDLIRSHEALYLYNGISVSPYLCDKIESDIAQHVLGLALWTPHLDSLMDKVRPSAFVSNGTRDDDEVIAELCKKKLIDSVLISHGSHIMPKNRYEMIEWGEHGRTLLRSPFAFYALQTPLSEGYLKVFPTESKTLKTGPLIWGREIDRGMRKDGFEKMFKGRYDYERTRIIVHAGTPKPSNGLRFYVYETPDEYIQAVRDVAYAVQETPGVVLIVRFRPSSEVSAEDIKRAVPFSDKVILSAEGPFSDVLRICDLLVSFSSTTIEEALQNRIPVLLYGGGGRYQHLEANEVREGRAVIFSAVNHVRCARDLKYAMTSILEARARTDAFRDPFNTYIYDENQRESLSLLLRKGL